MLRNKVSVLIVLVLVLMSVSILAEELVVYSTIFAEYAEAMKREFEKANPGVIVHVINPGGTEAMLKKLEAEKDNPQADVVHSGASLNYEYAKSKGLLEPYFPNVANFEPVISVGENQLRLSDPEGYYHVWSMMFSGFMINKQVLDALGLPVPKSFKDLTNPIYKGQIIAPNPLKSSTAVTVVMTVMQAYGQEEGWKLWDEIDKNIPYYSNSSSKIYSLTAKGEFAIALCLSRPVFVYKMQGYPVDFVYPSDGSMIADNAMGIVKGAKHPELAKKFIDFILSDQMQKEGSKYLYTPVKKGVIDPSEPFSLEAVASTVENLILPDSDFANEVRPIMQEKFGEYIRSK
ncbi:hypothetical protein AT15_05345 [Kosmotoga arenicorallina S304]|uniref:ABC transporter substrate-binding protein n=1 Tax=Kosmotoga arenicorallina S304 TaxID=1453497 RepID=A0A176JUI9_9BACT|nr:extracellular solute-binding protein [Kosmotoga arenicorallina]OAA27117.1 hypothetical protein AT15_05345 [Kosmotoga arenicorallina S304]